MNRDLEALYLEAERRAERLIALIRICVALALAATFWFAVVGTVPAGAIVLERQLAIAIATIAGYFLFGVVSLFLSAPGWSRRWYAFVFVTLDVAMVIPSLWLNRVNTGLGPPFSRCFRRCG